MFCGPEKRFEVVFSGLRERAAAAAAVSEGGRGRDAVGPPTSRVRYVNFRHQEPAESIFVRVDEK